MMAWFRAGTSLLMLVLLTAGCAGGKSYRLGREAEQRGDAHQAYDFYCKAAKESPGDGSIAASMERIAPTAATYWHSQARIAGSEGRYSDAWRMAIRCLEIRPNHVEAIQFVDQLEREHPTVVASARQAWLRSGSKSLTVAKSDGVQVASARPGKARPKARRKPSPNPSPQSRSTSPAQNRPKAAKRTKPTPGPRITANRIGDPEKPMPLPPQPKPSPPPENAKPTKAAVPPNDSPTAQKEGEYLVVRTLSKRDKRFKRRMKAVDGIFIKLKDTEEEPDVDLDLYQGDRRVQKIRNLKVGRSKIFRGRSGSWYRLTVLKIHHKSHTVRLGIKAA
ncbi:MAG: hypothetical protein MI923_28595 [Phycisphaerales bacterium]|nr:hypothetical protein [Phycisphaerales bacterium]